MSGFGGNNNTFSFGAGSASGFNKTSGAGSTGGLFGSVNGNNATNTSGSPFGTFGTNNNTSASGAAPIPNAQTTNQGGSAPSLFGNTNASANANTNMNTNTTAAASANKTSLFGNTNTATGSSFGGFGSQNKEAKPAVASGALFGGLSTANSGSELFGRSTNNAFGASSAAPAAEAKLPTDTAPAPAAASNTPSLFGKPSENSSASTGGNLFGGLSKPAEAKAEPAKAAFSFGAAAPAAGASTTTTSSLFGQSTATTAKSSGFPFGGTSNGTVSEKKDDNQNAPKSLFGTSTATEEKKGEAPKLSFGFSASKDTSGSSNKPAAGFSFGAPKKDDTKTDADTKPSFGFGATKPAETKATEPESTESKSTESKLTEPKLAGVSFGTAKSAEPKNESNDPPKSALLNTSASSAKPGEAAKTETMEKTAKAPVESVPVQPGQYLKNKSFEDIISKWTSSLSTAVDRFKKQAEKTAKWDQILVENGTKIAEIYNEIMVVEQAQTRIDDVLGYVGRQQDDIDAMLTQLEKQTSSGNASGLALETLQPFDKERYDAYSLADKLTTKLDGLESSLSSIIGEMNSLTRETHHIKESDPVADIVKILNSHLASLQFIDESANELQKKLVEVHAQSSRMKI